ncbi:MAG: hypothetical protein ABS79_00375 [Planctomycetes bacterium SCN 63-9]|nr:MAG: hypothetical protein ABS79_00375 [Planctomycetes bacterium SCN 63-9]
MSKIRRVSPFTVAIIGIVAIGLAVRVGLIGRSGLWADEFFSLAIATGHSLEHPADVADPSRGDFIEAEGAVPPADYGRYLNHDIPAADPARVVRAVLLSDTSPPLYYLTLYAWTRLFGTGDAALRLFSVAFWLACLPLMGMLARRLSGRRAVLPAYLLFSASPLCVHYSTEGRMYSMLWFLILTTAWLTLSLHRRPPSAWRWSAWILASSAGMLTHYFFVFSWAGCVAWLVIHPGRSRRPSLVAALLLTGLLIAPWYARLPQSLEAWRITQDWLKVGPDSYSRTRAFLKVFWNYFSPEGGRMSRAAMLALLSSLICMAAWKDGARWRSTRRQFLWSWLLAAAIGPFVFDQLRGTYTATYPRYSIGGMPPAYLLVAVALAGFDYRARVIYCALLVATWSVGIRHEWAATSRAMTPYREAAAMLAEGVREDDLVIVHSIPSGVLGISRYMEPQFTGPARPGVAAWVGQLGRRRVPGDIESLVEGRRRVRFVNIHSVHEPAPEESWLRRNATLAHERQLQACYILEFVPRGSETFGANRKQEPADRRKSRREGSGDDDSEGRSRPGA